MGFTSKNYKVSDLQESGKVAKHRNEKGISWVTAAIFIVGDMMGGGMIALPVALSNTGMVAGIILIILGALFTGYTGVQLADNWTMMQKRWSEYKDHCRRPYPEMAKKALGPKAGFMVSVCLCLTQFGIITVLSLLAANNVSNFLKTNFDISLSLCTMILIVGGVCWPFSMLKSPMDFWQAAVAAALSSTIAAVFIIVGSVHDSKQCLPEVNYPEFSISRLFLGYGTIAFAYGGHGAFPTIQHDMTKPFRFNRAVIASYIFILIVYLAVATTGYTIYGGSLEDTIIPSLQLNWIMQAVNVMITLHVFPTIIIVFSPLAQQMEEWTSIPQAFGWKRFVLRSAIMFLSVFTALSIPRFGVFMDLVGGSTITLMTMLLPSVFYLFLFASHKKRKEMISTMQLSPDSPDDQFATIKDIWTYTSKPILIFNIASFLFGLIGGIAASTSAISSIINSEFSAPCYVNWGLSLQSGGAIHCCGEYSNISIYNDIASCKLTKLH